MLLALGLAANAAAQARTLTVLHNFTKGTGVGAFSGLIRDSAGNLYGTTEAGGSTFCGGLGCGTVFKVDTGARYIVLYRFTGGLDGKSPIGGVIRDAAAGNLYGTTTAGGASGNGTVFKLDRTGKETTLYAFTGLADGGGPTGSLVRDAAGNLYGTTTGGGHFNCIQGFSSACGTVFKVDSTGNESVLYSFLGPQDGAVPYSGVILDAAGNLYGTASSGGDTSSCGGFGCGTVFQIDNSGVFTELYSFTGGSDGNEPTSPLTLDAAGNLYGTTDRGGDLTVCSGFGCGVVFKVSGTGTETVLHAFDGRVGGSSPIFAKLIRGVGGAIWGTARDGGDFGRGVVYRLNPDGTVIDLFAFMSGADGGSPDAGVIRDPSGNFYGITNDGGNLHCGGGNGCGTVFKLNALAP
jgi:uncharacterized repeat protein (TIGR03803 family)